ncbi:MAG: TonB-dependent receptor [Gammaproteobacteria bacterium]|nr:TonB-dependent receptor [Gammaproteobacteria bacterium]
MFRWLTVGLLVCLLPVPVTANVSSTSIEEIVVTVRKREESLLEVPVAVSVFNADAIRELNLNRLEELARFVPSFGFDAGFGRQVSSYRPTMRGLTTIRNGVANTSVLTTFVDGVYVGGSVQSTELNNLARVEILRGPQAAQYGRGTYAGAINYVTRAPGDEFAGEVSASAGEHSSYALKAWASGPITDRLGFFVGAGYDEYGGEYRNQRDGSAIGDEQQTELTAKLRWRPSDSVSVNFRVGWQDSDDGHFAVTLQPRTLNNCCERTPDAPRAREYYVGTAVSLPVNLFSDLLDQAGGAGVQQERWLTSLRVDWELTEKFQFTSVTGYVHDDIGRGFDLSYAAYDPVFFVAPGLFTVRDELRQTDLSQEFRLMSAGDPAWRWSLGAYAYAGELDDRSNLRVFLDANDQVMTAPNLGPLSQEEVENFAVFGAIETEVIDRLTLGAEFRWARDEITLTNRLNDGTGQLEGRFSNSWRSLTPRFTAVFAAREDLRLYANVAKGVKPGDFNTEVPDEQYRLVDEESVWSYELGLKGSTGSGTSYSLAVYRQDVDDQQLTTLVELADGRTASLLTNVGETRIDGFEAEFGFAVNQVLRLDLTYAWTDARYRNYISVDQADLRGSDGSPADNERLGSVAGNRLPRVPVHMASAVIMASRELPGIGDGYLTADWSYESSRFAQEHNLIATGDRHLVGLQAGLRFGAWDIRLWARNLLDDDTPADIGRYFDTQSGFLPSFPQAGERPSGSPRGFAVNLPRGRQVGATLRFYF